jgi:hypothetical protein
MYKRALVIPIRTHTAQQLLSVNQKLEALSTKRPYGDVAEMFALAAYLATEAVQAAALLQALSGRDGETLQPVLEFWRGFGSYARNAASSLGGHNKTLAQALVAFHFLRNLGEDV